MSTKRKAEMKEKMSAAKRRLLDACGTPSQPMAEQQLSNAGTSGSAALDLHSTHAALVEAVSPGDEVPVSTLHTSEQNVNVPGRAVTGSSTGKKQSGFAWFGLKVLQGVLEEGAEVFGPLMSAVTHISQCIDVFEKDSQLCQEYETLKIDLDASFTNLTRLLATAKTPTAKEAIAQAVDVIKHEIASVVEKHNQSKTVRLKDATEGVAGIESFYRRIQHIMTQLTIYVHTSILENANEHSTDQRVKNLPNSPDACYNSAQATKLRRGACTPDTRVELLHELQRWSQDLQTHRIYWLNGMAGTGKTTIAYSVCERLRSSDRLAASFFCSRQLPECREVNRIIPSIAYQLSLRSSIFRDRLSEILEKTPDAYNRPLGQQLDQLIAAPLRMAGDKFPLDWIVVVDALDECDDKDRVDQLLEAVLARGLDLPLRFFVTSRPEAKIRDRMMDEQYVVLRHEMRLHELDHTIVQEDIQTYLTAELKRAKMTPAQLATLVARAGVLFIYAATVVRYIGYDNFSKCTTRLKQVLRLDRPSTGSPERHVDSLYGNILEEAIQDPDMEEEERSLMVDILSTVVCAREPLSLDSIGRLLGLEGPDQVASALRPLGSVLNLPEKTGVVTTLHESFPSYMLDANRSGRLCCMPQKHNASMAHRCFNLIEQVKLPFNVCNLESSFTLDNEVPELSSRIQSHISDALLYACCCWAEHLERSGQARNLTDPFERLMRERLLLWVEVMNLKRHQSQIGVALNKAMKWGQTTGCSVDTMELIQDAVRFAKVFCMGLAWCSTPHIYISGLAYWPKRQALSKQYTNLINTGILMTGTAMDGQAFQALGIIQAGSTVPCVAYSPGGARVVSGSADNTLRIWDAHTGQQVGQPLTGHTGNICSVAYSPDDAHVASGSGDRTIRIWDARTGQQVGQPLIGHTGSICSVVYSPDGMHIVTGSGDRTLRIWDAQSGQQVGQPLTGHTDRIWSVAYSPDGAYIASGSVDKTLRIWDAHSCKQVGQSLTGHTDYICSIAYSPDGAHIVSGSVDRTLRIWDARTGRQVGQPLTGHTECIYSVAYSPDGAHIASGSGDRTLRIWDARTGQQVGLPLTGHTNCVWSIAYSPDGAHIASGSYDCTLCIWDAYTGQKAGPLLTDHTGSIRSVAYSPDGAHIASGSYDCSLCIWDAHTCKKVGPPLTGHTGSIRSVAYSPDSAHIVSGSVDRTLRIWDAHTGQQVGQPLIGHTGSIFSVVYSPDGTYIASGSYDCSLCIWDAHTGQQIGLPLTGHTECIYTVAYSPDGAHIASGSGDRTLRIWDVCSGEQVGQPLMGHTDRICSVAYSPDGTHIVSGADDSTLRIWDAHTGQQVGQPFTGHAGSVRSVTYSPEGAHIASGADDSTLRIWDAHTGQQVGLPLTGHTGSIRSVTYSPDGARIVSGSYDCTLRIWDAPNNLVSLFSCHLASPSAIINCDFLPSQTHHPNSVPPCSSTQSCSHSPTDICYCSWTLDHDGWIINGQNQRLVWIPSRLRASLLSPRNTSLISQRGVLRVDFSKALLGQDWTRCYQSA